MAYLKSLCVNFFILVLNVTISEIQKTVTISNFNRFICLAAFLSVLNCAEPPKQAPVLGFFHWKTSLRIKPSEERFLTEVGCKFLYLKCLDIGLDPSSGATKPLSLLQIEDSTVLSEKILVACVFIKNEVFLEFSKEKSTNLVQKIVKYCSKYLPEKTVELQIDCDWTNGTQSAYFKFLSQLRAAMKNRMILSATIRLHQYKSPELTGVPPVDRGMLMLYNTGDIDDFNSKNSIFELEDAAPYRSKGAYPLPLDLALPLFQWGLVYREFELWKIIDAFPEQELKDSSRFVSIDKDQVEIGLKRYQIQKNTFISGHFLRPGDLLKIEKSTPALLEQALDFAAHIDLANDARLTFFDLDSTTCTQFDPKLLRSFAHKLRAHD
jgi:hypothetical protein